MLFVYQVIITAVLLVVLVILLINVFTFRSLSSYGFLRKFGPEDPLVSVLIPARNEATNIGSCLRSLLRQDYPNYEIIVLDDGSEDATATIVTSIAAEDPANRIRLVSGQELPAGWLGKNYACHQLSQQAHGEFLLFTDADTVHNARSISSGVSALQDEAADFLSVFPRQEVVTLPERLAMPLMMLYVIGMLPIWLVKRNPRPSFSAANGQYMLFRRATYDTIGGHETVKGEVLEDVQLGRMVKTAGFRQLLPDGSDTVSCRMYRTPQDVWLGFSKNLFAQFRYRLNWAILFVAVNLLVFVGPYLWLLLWLVTSQPVSPEWLWLPLAQVVMAWFIRLGVSQRLGFPFLDIFLHPVGIIYMVAVMFNSIRWQRTGVSWKGRVYTRAEGEK